MNGQLLAFYSEKPESGKSTVAKHLEIYGFRTTLLSQPLLDRCFEDLRGALPHESDDALWSRIFDHKATPIPELSGLSPRAHMAGQAAALRARLGMNALADIAWAKVHDALARGQNTIIDGLRTNAEAEYFSQRGAKTVNILRPDSTATTLFDSNTLSGWTFDATIINNGSLEQLKAAADLLVIAPPARGGKVTANSLQARAPV